MVQPFEREALLDLVVNAIPLAILVLFGVLFTVSSPWGGFSLETALQLGILAVFGVGVVAVTYWVGKLVVAAEVHEDEAHVSDSE
jgi:hypothetical protein